MIIYLLISALLISNPGDSLWKAICWKESSNNPSAYNKPEKAAGIIQIRPIYVADINRIIGWEAYTLADRWSVEKSREMFEIYTGYWIGRYGLEDTPENRSRIFNGGPRGWQKPATIPCWKAVERKMNYQ
jgi:hypothetical protein